MRHLVFDTEMTGDMVLLSANAKVSLEERPHLIQLAYAVVECSQPPQTPTDPVVADYACQYVRLPRGCSVSAFAENFTHITTEMCRTQGHEPRDVLRDLMRVAQTCDVLVGHNVKFDVRMVEIEIQRVLLFAQQTSNAALRDEFTHFLNLWRLMPTYCTMRRGTALCRLPRAISKTGGAATSSFKYPKLKELYAHCFPDTDVAFQAHDAMGDVQATARCFAWMEYHRDLARLCPAFFGLGDADADAAGSDTATEPTPCDSPV